MDFLESQSLKGIQHTGYQWEGVSPQERCTKFQSLKGVRVIFALLLNHTAKSPQNLLVFIHCSLVLCIIEVVASARKNKGRNSLELAKCPSDAFIPY